MKTVLAFCLGGGALPAAAAEGSRLWQGGAGDWRVMVTDHTSALWGVLLLVLSLLLAASFLTGGSARGHRRGRLSSVGEGCEGGVQELPTGPAARDGGEGGAVSE